jgi:ATP-dependent Lon protease
VTLRGRVLEIGGVKEKVLAAYRAGLREVVLPAANEKDVRGLSAAVRDQMRLTFVRGMDEVLDQLLLAPLTVTPAADAPQDAPQNAPQDAPRTAPPARADDAWPG